MISQPFQDTFKYCIDFVDDIENGLQAAVEHFFELFTNLGLFVLYLTTVTFVDYLIPVFIIVITIIDFISISRAEKYEYKNINDIKRIDNRIKTIEVNARQKEYVKDIKVYKAKPFFVSWYDNAITQKVNIVWETQKRYLRAYFSQSLLSVFRDTICYFYLIYQLYLDTITLSDFVFLLAIITGFSGNIANVFAKLALIAKDKMGISELDNFLKEDQLDEKNKKTKVNISSQVSNIRFENVSYQYDQAQEWALKDVSFEIAAGEHIGLVGLNGAGKTTLMLLLCGLLSPTKGNIYINNINIKDISAEKYLDLFSVVFQDVNMLNFSIDENIRGIDQQNKNYDEFLEAFGMADLIQQLGKDKVLGKIFAEDGIELSGGEKQKLALVRALYKDAAVFILDEPMSALDPLMEEKIISNYKKLFKDKTSIHISHRLSSTRLCDKIFLLNNGCLVEKGTHEELMKMQGEYCKLFVAQQESYGLL